MKENARGPLREGVPSHDLSSALLISAILSSALAMLGRGNKSTLSQVNDPDSANPNKHVAALRASHTEAKPNEYRMLPNAPEVGNG